MNRFDFTPYRRSTVGFDRLFDLLENQVRGNGGGDNYPPFNIERRNEDIDAGQRRLLAAVGQLGPTTSHATLNSLVTEVSDPQRDDDVAVLVVRRKPA